jgi:hypothetical protein
VYNESDIVDSKLTDQIQKVEKSRSNETDDETDEIFLAGGLGDRGKTTTSNIWKVLLNILYKWEIMKIIQSN